MSSSLRSGASVSRYRIKERQRRHALCYHVENHIDLETTISTQQAYEIALAANSICKRLAKLRFNILQDGINALHPRDSVTVAWGINEAKVPLKHSIPHTFPTAQDFCFFDI